jgi:general secretion pathway protein F
VEIDFLTGRVSLSDVVVFTRLLATLLRAVVPLVQSLGALVEQTEKKSFAAALSQVRQKVVEGTALHGAMKEHPKIFDDLYLNMVRAGEASGQLEVVLSRLTDFLEAEVKLRGKVLAAFIYPIIMTLLGSAIVIFLMTFVVPKVTQLYDQQEKALPFITEILIAVSDVFTSWWGWTCFILPFMGLVVAFFVWKRTKVGKPVWDRFVLKIPLFGGLVRMIAISRFSKTLSTLLASGVPLLTAMDIVKDILGNQTLVDVIETARLNIREGESIAGPLKRSGHFPPIVTHMIAVGEQAGQLEEMLDNVAVTYEQQVDLQVQALTSLMEPVLIVAMGGAVAFIVFAIMLPILNLNEGIV